MQKFIMLKFKWNQINAADAKRLAQALVDNVVR